MIGKTLFGAACAAMIMAASGMSSAAYADTPRQFLTKAIEGDNSEMMLGRIAEMRGDTQSMREFGKTLIDDHRAARTQAEGVAQQLGVPIPHNTVAQAMHERERLSGLRNSQFDREFARFMVRDHQKDLVEFRTEAAAHQGMVSKLAREQLPTLQKHLDMASALYREPIVAEAETR
jgi:putative membrane protein